MHLISQPTSLSTHYIGLQVWNPLLSPLPLSPRLSTGVITYSTTYLLTPNVLQLLLSLYATGITKLAFATSMARGGMLRVMVPGGECARFHAVVLNAYKECPVLDQEDGRRYL